MGRAPVTFRNVSFAYDAASTRLMDGLTAHFPPGWTGVVGANGAGKTTLLKLATGRLTPLQGTVGAPANAIYCPQRTDDLPPLLDNLVGATDGPACQIKGRLGIEAEWLGRWDTLSHGERKRAQIAVALWRRPDVLAVDEPTNHLDAEARNLLATALRVYPGVGLLVSHDRQLLDDLCVQCLFLDPPDAVMRPGGYTQGSEQATRERKHTRKRREIARQRFSTLKRAAVSRRAEASGADRRRSKRGVARRDSDAREQIDRARATGKDGAAGRRVRQLEGRLAQAQETLDLARVKKTYAMGIWLEGARSKRDALFALPAGSIPLGGARRLTFPDLAMRPDDRIALTGPNGGGKSTLVRCVLSGLKLPRARVTYVPQEIDLDASRGILDQAREAPSEVLGRMMNVVSRLGSRPDRLLESEAPSPGEVRKLLLAMGIANRPHLIIMDEPTNHLDLPSIECLEGALDDCPCGLLLVSHDRRFLRRLTRTRWHISRQKDRGDAFLLRESRRTAQEHRER